MLDLNPLKTNYWVYDWFKIINRLRKQKKAIDFSNIREYARTDREAAQILHVYKRDVIKVEGCNHFC